MGLHTTLLGRITISPPLSVSDVDLVRSFSPTGNSWRPELQDSPLGSSPWSACDDGCCLHWDGVEKPQLAAMWLRYVMDLVPPEHAFNGMIVGERHEHRELFALVVKNGRVSRKVLMQGVSDSEAWGDLPLDQQQAERNASHERRRMRYAAAVARDLARREDEAHDGPAA